MSNNQFNVNQIKFMQDRLSPNNAFTHVKYPEFYNPKPDVEIMSNRGKDINVV